MAATSNGWRTLSKYTIDIMHDFWGRPYEQIAWRENEMDLSKLFEMQRKLDEHIIKQKGLEGQDLTLNTVTALIVELGEFANEGRWFKHWSNDQEPRTKGEWKYSKGIENGKFIDVYENPLLEEYVDCLHFFLSLANKKGWQDLMYLQEDAILEVEEEGFDGGLSGAFVEMIYHLTNAFMRKNNGEEIAGMIFTQFSFRSAWFIFVAIGIVGFKFTLEEIEQAYLDKNKVNHHRQESGY